MHFIFRKGDFSHTPLATYTESTAAVPCVPTSDYQYTDITSTIHSFPHLFPIITPINANQLKLLLCNHPNLELVCSICHGLRSGFWPFTDMASPESIPQGSIAQPHGLLALDNASQNFLRSQHDTEISLGQYLPAFGSCLLPGMVSQPIFTVPKKGSMKLCLVNDHSASLKSLNSLIPTEGGFVILDNLSDLSANIWVAMCKNLGMKLKLLWKSEASEAYRWLPMHPHWQVWQATLIDGEYHIDCCAVFGNHTSSHLWCLFFGLVCWVWIHELGIEGLLHYVDDAFNVSFNDKLTFYHPYQCLMLADQTCFLLPHEDKKQLHGATLEIIGLVVSLKDMTISMSSKAKQKLIDSIHDFVLNMPDNKCQQPL